MKQVYCDWCQRMISQGETDPGLEQIFISRQIEGDSSADYEEYDVHPDCALEVMKAVRDVMKNISFRADRQ